MERFGVGDPGAIRPANGKSKSGLQLKGARQVDGMQSAFVRCYRLPRLSIRHPTCNKAFISALLRWFVFNFTV
jgi:hypothetical protein